MVYTYLAVEGPVRKSSRRGIAVIASIAVALVVTPPALPGPRAAGASVAAMRYATDIAPPTELPLPPWPGPRTK